MTKVLITDPIDQTGIDILSQVAQVDQKIGISDSELASIIKDYDALMIRSGTQVTEEIINSWKDASSGNLIALTALFHWLESFSIFLMECMNQREL